MLQLVNTALNTFDDLVWGVPLIVLILATGIYLTIRLKGMQILRLPAALRYMVQNEEEGHGEVTSFGALCTAMSATIGTGNIVGVATAIVAGGPGALFWMWVAAFFGMATKYAEGVLAICYRMVDKETGHVLGGPFYYIENGMGKNWRWMGKIFAFFGAGVGLLGIGTFTQVNGITSAVGDFFDSQKSWTVGVFGREYSAAVLIAGLVLTVCVALVVLGGLERIATVSQIIVPFMAIFYVAACVLILIVNAQKVPGAFRLIVESAFGLRAAAGGTLGAVLLAMQKGIARGIFSNEAGLGSAPIAAAAARTKEPVRQGLVSMTGTFIDTIIICTLTGLVIVISGAWTGDLNGAALTNEAFCQAYPVAGSLLLCVGLTLFAFTTILGWNYYGERCINYLVGVKGILPYRIVFIILVACGAFLKLDVIWILADIVNGLMAIPNLVALIGLSGVVVSETKLYFKHVKQIEMKKETGETVAENG